MSSSSSAPSLADLLTASHSLAPDAFYKEYFNLLRKMDADQAQPLAAGVQTKEGVRDPLELLNMRKTGTILALFILVSRLRVSPMDRPRLKPHLERFAEMYDVEVAAWFPDLMHQLGQGLRVFAVGGQAEIGQAMRILRTIVGTYAPPGTLTTLHTIFAETVIYSRQPVAFLPFTPISHPSTSYTPITYRDHLLYHYYSSVIHGMLGDWEMAEECAELVVGAPTQGGAVSQVMLDGWKKLVLVQLLGKGKTSPAPKWTSPTLSSLFKSLGSPYTSLASAYESGSLSSFNSLLETHRNLFHSDQNLGLVYMCQEQMKVRAIERVAKTWKRLGLQELTRLVEGLQAGEKEYAAIRATLMEMNASGTLLSSIDDANNVTFLSSSSPSSSSAGGKTQQQQDVLERTKAAILRSSQLGKTWDYEGGEMLTTKEFITKALTASAQSGQAGGAQGGIIPEEGLDVVSGEGAEMWDD